jgi:hypothetical protein
MGEEYNTWGEGCVLVQKQLHLGVFMRCLHPAHLSTASLLLEKKPGFDEDVQQTV